jgi:hypothetical protein
MAALDFPANPTNGQQFGKFTFNGIGWQGGAQAQGVSNAEQFFALDGLGNLDVQVPAWAKGCEITGAIYIVNTAYLMARVSMDGTTFLAGATDYIYSGAQHNSQGAASAYITYPGAGTTGFTLSATGNNGLYPINVNAEMILARGSATQYITSKSYAKNYNSTASAGYLTYWSQDLLGGAPMGSGLQVRALRFFLTSGNFGAGSWLRIKWLGDLAQQSNGVSIVDAPADGGEYVRINNIWRLKTQTLDMSGALPKEVTVPTGARFMRAEGALFRATTTAAVLGWRASLDGTNYMQGAADYYYTGFAHYTGSAGFANVPGAAISYGMIGNTQDYVNIGEQFRLVLGLTKPAGNVSFTGLTWGSNYLVAAANAYQDLLMKSFLLYTNAGANLAMRKVQFLTIPNVAYSAPSYISIEWLY